MKKLNNKKAGFSLVELMVVVAIIGILASIAVPNFLKFQAKAKQSSAKTMLSGLYSAEKTFFAEYNTFHQNLPYIGFVPDGIPLTAGTNCPAVASAGGIRSYEVGFLTIGTGASITNATGTAPSCGALVLADYVTSFRANPVVAAPAAGPIAAALTGTNTFQALAHGIIGQDATLQDHWTINQDKVLANTISGI